MSIETVAILSPGEMGGAVGGAFAKHGFDVITSLDGRSDATRERALTVGFRDGGSLAEIVTAADIVLSIMPPEHAAAQAEAVAAAMVQTGHTPPFADCNAVSPETAKSIGADFAKISVDFIDGGIIGSPPGSSNVPARLYVSGPGAETMSVFDGKGIEVRQCGPEIGRGSAVKMAYAGISKGTSALHAAVLIAAERLGVAEELHDELRTSTPALYKRMESITPALPAVSERYIGEMLEIAETMRACGVTPGFHEGAAELYSLLLKSPFSSERRDTVDKNRSLRQTMEACARVDAGEEAAE